MNPNRVAIIGAGPAGIACAIQLSRYGIMPLLFERDIPGGLLKNANLVENYPGYPGGISGTSLVRKMTKQLELSKVPVIRENVTDASCLDFSFKIETDLQEYNAEILVIATGTSPIEFPIYGYEHISPGRIFYEVYPIRNVRNSRIAIIGAGDAAFDYALQLSQYNKVTIMNRSEKIKCLPLLWIRAMGAGQISYYENHVLVNLTADHTENCLKLLFQTGNEMESHMADYIIFATGRRPELRFVNPSLFDHLEEFQQKGKLFLVGDVKNDLLRQASIAAGEGIRAAMEIYFNESHKENR